MLKSLLRVKPIEPAGRVDAGEPVEGSLQGEATLQRTLTAKHLIMLGIGAVIGAGIFVMTGQAAANHAGPAVMLSFVFAGIACTFAGLCYAEFAAMMPVSGSAYSYSYATLGEGIAWFIGWCLVLEYLFAGSSVAVAWSAYLISFITGTLGLPFPTELTNAPLAWINGEFVASGNILNLPAVLIVAAVSGLCYVGITQSAFINAIVVAIKIAVICLFVGFGAAYIDPANWHPFIPENTAPGVFGWSGVFRAASIVFFAYIGFDAVSTSAGETKDPQRNMPIGILGSLAVCTIIYIIVCAVLTGLMPYTQLGTAAGGHCAGSAPATDLAQDCGGDRRDRRPVLGGAGDADGTAAHLLHHGQGWVDAQTVRQGAPEIPHAICRHRDRGGGRRITGGVDPAQRAG